MEFTQPRDHSLVCSALFNPNVNTESHAIIRTDDKKNDDLILECCQNMCAFEEVTATAESRVVRRDVVLITEDRYAGRAIEF